MEESKQKLGGDDCHLCGGSGEVAFVPIGAPDSEQDVFGCPGCIQAERDQLQAQRDQLLGALELLLERIPEPPGANCSCHISPPCNDCMDYAGEREAFEIAKCTIAAVKGGAEC